VLHHAIEKSHLEVLQVLLEHGVDVYSAIEIADNGGRTPLFEAVDNNCSAELVAFLIKKRKEGGFGAKVNVLNFNGHSPLYSAAREGNLPVVQLLCEEGHACVDLYGESRFEEEEEAEEAYDSIEEKYFMEAFRNAMTPLLVSIVLGHEDVMHYLIEKGANPNLQTTLKGYSALHVAVLANKPELIIELLTKSTANPLLPDFSGRTLRDMIELFIPDYLDAFDSCK